MQTRAKCQQERMESTGKCSTKESYGCFGPRLLLKTLTKSCTTGLAALRIHTSPNCSDRSSCFCSHSSFYSYNLLLLVLLFALLLLFLFCMLPTAMRRFHTSVARSSCRNIRSGSSPNLRHGALQMLQVEQTGSISVCFPCSTCALPVCFRVFSASFRMCLCSAITIRPRSTAMQQMPPGIRAKIGPCIYIYRWSLESNLMFIPSMTVYVPVCPGCWFDMLQHCIGD